jgi:hypothetical protein
VVDKVFYGSNYFEDILLGSFLLLTINPLPVPMHEQISGF